MNTAALTTRQNWQWQGNSIHYVQAGARVAGKPPLLLVHGFGASTDHWRKNVQGLASEWEVWAIDLLGFGRSAKPDIVYSGNLWQQQLNDFIKEVVGQPTVLAGNSLGGYASLCVAANHSENVRGLILLNSAGPFSDTESNRQPNLAQKLLRSMLLQPWASYLLFLYTRQPKTIRKTLEKVYLDRSAITEQLIEDIRRPSLDAGAAKVFASVFKSPRGENVDILLQKLSCPLLMLWGEGDPWMNTRERGAKFRQYYPSLTEYYLTAGHCPHDEIPTEVNRLISDWMKSL
ncbi:MAG: alpha/beta fold hydrolase [Microcystis aeruginosa Ma_QC_Ca_00000000_S207]|jgi:pimeloyl-ACP methyl ester carboxylesterase|uniref:Alpha/beta fold hydrolase n=1 Tax=Microcystis aeruginosa Ma_QC_Ca_00000000_S207 TaxID=2486251 RepID=A0A552FYX7_MICAE|nr:alpha/beta fold hydrolase [Microcystis sp. M113S1]NCQ68829.1 alpha/beta fold hydrolase [Microcystis aeruginosa W13-16]NCQ73347.1 alpha/beta fold hydrolase [Microcystis aeruginosa W13-13]NCQ77856.1 alpha/beta fold hydrolase [Microcystis aeruginosa W13-15]NCR21902.1 alpha/beta fold hydrolase [Microcystis aeruginosa L111-01]NCS44664.1 alpha/beta fold hydrolase [Microcystis aeruginosa BS11-05]NCS53732.1 alpha/beta fold hydrolase [Microcystis aeruginosa G13-05]TRU51950.1 MAG: alpha/beta fold h